MRFGWPVSLILLCTIALAFIACNNIMSSLSGVKSSLNDKDVACHFSYGLSVCDRGSAWINVGGEKLRNALHGSIRTVYPIVRFPTLVSTRALYEPDSF